MNRIVNACLALTLTFFFAACSEAPPPPQGLGPLETVVFQGSQDGWSGTLTDGVYTLANPSDEGAIKYFYSPYEASSDGSREISVLVDASESSAQGRAGLLYGFEQSLRSYYAIVISADNQLEIYRRDRNGLAMKSSSSFDPSDSGYNRIDIKEDGSSIDISVNGRTVTSLQSSELGRGAVGILAMGTGSYRFTNYRESGDATPSATQSATSKAKPSTKGSAASAPPVSQPASKFKDQEVPDVSRNNVAAYNVFVPEGWIQEGKFEQVQAYNNVPYFGSVDVKAPDGRAFSYLPLLEFTYTDFAQLQFMQPYEGRPAFRQPNSLGEIMQSIVRANPKSPISNLQIVSEEPVPELIESARRHATPILQQIEAANRQAGQFGERQTYHIDARKLVFRYQENGKQIESTTFATITNYSFVQPNGATRIAKWNLLNAVALAGPVGTDYLNDPQLAAVARSVRMNPDWAYAIDQWQQGVRQLAIREGMAKAAAAQRNWKNTAAAQGEDVLDISFNGWKSRNASSDRSQSSFVNSIHERTTYATAGGNTVNLPSYYRNVYTDGQGNYILHNNALYDVNTDPNLNSRNWTRIQEAR